MLSSLPSGTQIGTYRIDRLLGRGGMSTVYLAEHAGLKRRVALKVLSAEMAADERFRERFIRESELAASLEDPNVLPIYEAGEHDGVLFIAMRYVEGRDLKTMIREEGPLDAVRTERIVDQVANALDAAHAKGLVHRDVKPGNILVAPGSGSRAEHAYLSDFGLSKRAASDSGLTATGVFAGTLNYAAPEQFEGGPLDGRTDIYSLGCVLFECLTGELPFRRDQDAALMYAHLHEPPPEATSLRSELPPEVDRVIETAMAKRPSERYATAGDLAAALRGAIGGERRAHAPPRSTLGVWVGIAGAIVAIGVAIAIVTLTRSGGNPDESSRPSPSIGSGILPAGSLARIDPETGDPSLVVHDVPGLEHRSPVDPRLAIGEGGVWLYSCQCPAPGTFILHLDQATGQDRERINAEISLGSGAGLAVGSRTVWFSGSWTVRFTGSEGVSAVSRINPSSYESLAPVSVRAGAVTDIVLGGGALWVGSSDETLTTFDPLTGARLDEIPIDGTPDSLGNEVIRIDPSNGRVTARIPVNGNLKGIAAGDGGIWVLDETAGTATQIDSETGSVHPPVGLGPAPSAIAVGLGSAWVTDAEDGNLYRIDPQLERATPIPLGAPLAAVAIDEASGSLWVGVFTPE
ncbi:MAG TPA: protein kinase [Actinomycetota bacterium]|nr:protein kinase [Actinomycetota bacterium]